ncbi:hypothetical protein [Micromonospora sp. WMMD980]|uniref:hypothetical protein n=1 Tax=Micromonospora sp. WMMD980 TaxID=3016088 RepID=UPI0024178649|nr:hypothetical protein [Micromonospora sp. WMMD980]MDG4803283.1 hypothetical protein [Micromonospora sp. WMMD980]
MSARDALNDLLRHARHARPEDLPLMARRAAERLGATDMLLYLVDHEQRELLPMPAPDSPHREPLAVEGTLAGRARRAACVPSRWPAWRWPPIATPDGPASTSSTPTTTSTPPSGSTTGVV